MREQGEFRMTKKHKTRKERSENFNTLINLQFPPSLPQSSPKCPLSPISEGACKRGYIQRTQTSASQQANLSNPFCSGGSMISSDREWKYILVCECSFQVLNEMTGGALGGFHRWLPLKSPLLLSVPPPFFEWSSVRNISWFFETFYDYSIWRLCCLFELFFFLGLFELCLPWKKFPVFFSSSIACVAFGPLYMRVFLDIVLNPVVMEKRMCQKSSTISKCNWFLSASSCFHRKVEKWWKMQLFLSVTGLRHLHQTETISYFKLVQLSSCSLHQLILFYPDWLSLLCISEWPFPHFK